MFNFIQTASCNSIKLPSTCGTSPCEYYNLFVCSILKSSLDEPTLFSHVVIVKTITIVSFSDSQPFKTNVHPSHKNAIIVIQWTTYAFIAEFLRIEDLKEVIYKCWDVRTKWKLLGIELGFDKGTLDSIDKSLNGNCDDCLIELLRLWLRNDAKPTQIALGAALKSKLLAVEVPPSTSDTSTEGE